MTTTEIPAKIVQCDCKVCGGRKAKVLDSGRFPMDRTMIHNLVCLAYGPMARAESTQRHGPWPVD